VAHRTSEPVPPTPVYEKVAAPPPSVVAVPFTPWFGPKEMRKFTVTPPAGTALDVTCTVTDCSWPTVLELFCGVSEQSPYASGEQSAVASKMVNKMETLPPPRTDLLL